MRHPVPILKDLVLLGGGHSHVEVLRRFGMQPIPGVRVTLISRDVETPYSGMLPGVVAGHYAHDDAHIDLEVLARFSGAVAIFDEAVGLDLAGRQVRFSERPPISYDVLSINIGSTPSVRVPGADSHAVPVKPIDRFLDRWSAVLERLRSAPGPRRLAVVGGGAGGVELILAAQHRARTILEREGRTAAHLEYHLFTDTDVIVPASNASVRAMFRRILDERGIVVHAGSPVVGVTPRELATADRQRFEADEILWTTEASAAAWLADSGLSVDPSGFVKVFRTLRSVSHPEVFAAGDAASMVESPRPKSGVFAVRQGAPLARNLRRALLGRPLVPYRAQRQFLSLISTGDRYAVASRGPLALRGRWVWRWKDSIDRRFMRRYRELPEMRRPAQAGDDAVRVFARTAAASSEAIGDKEDACVTETAPAPSGGVSQPLEGKTAGWCLAAEQAQVLLRLPALASCGGAAARRGKLPRCVRMTRRWRARRRHMLATSTACGGGPR